MTQKVSASLLLPSKVFAFAGSPRSQFNFKFISFWWKSWHIFLFVSTDEVAPGLSEVNDDDDDDDAGWYRREVGKEPDPGKYQHNNNNNLLFQV